MSHFTDFEVHALIHNPRKPIASYSKQHVVPFIDISQVKLSSSVFSNDYVKRYIKQVQALINEFNFDKLCFRRKWRYAEKEFIKRKGHNHFKFESI